MRAEQVKLMAAYNRWMNGRIYDVCAELSDEDRKLNREVFFDSIHGTLNHLLLGDKIWMGRFENAAFAVESLDQELHAVFDDLRADSANTDQRIENWAADLTDESLTQKFHYTSIVNPEPREYALWIPVTHFFNHQTHHRGQLTALLTQCGLDYGVTDLIWLPEIMATEQI